MQSSTPFRIAITATFTADPLRAPLEFWQDVLNTQLEVRFAPFGQVMQSLLDPASELRSNGHGINVVLFRQQDLGEAARREENLEALVRALEALPLAATPTLVIATAEQEQADFPGLAARLSARAGLYFLTDAWVRERYPVQKPFSPEGERLGAIPYTEDYFTALAASIIRVAHAHQHPPAKVLALDCDNTLWEGICGEDGPEGVRLSPGRESLQRFALEQREQGVLLVIASKNNQADVEATFAAHPEFPLHWEHFTAHRINWKPKPENLLAIAKELSLGIDSFVFIDDNRKEVGEMERELPPVVALRLPENDAEIARFTKHLWVFDRLRVTEADRERAASYQQTQEFGKALEQAQSLEDFHRNLELKVSVRGLEEDGFPRAAQLTQRTNQFNLTTVRRGEAELRQLWAERTELFRVDVSDRFGSYGFTGLLIGKPVGARYVVDTFLLSCRVLGRGVEHAVMRWLAEHAAKLGVKEVEIPFAATARNQPAAAFLEELGAREFPLRISPGDLAQVEVRFQAAEASPESPVEARVSNSARTLNYRAIATEYYSVDKLREAMRPAAPCGGENFATATEKRLAELWSGLLPGAELRAESNFFEAGGHSLLAVLLLARISESFGVELGIDEAYSIDMTLERMARRIDEALSFAGLSQEEYLRLAAEVEQMSDEEVRAALAVEEREEAGREYADTAGI